MRQLNIDTELKVGNKIFESFLVMDKGTERDIQNGIYESIPVTNNSLAALCWSPKQPKCWFTFFLFSIQNSVTVLRLMVRPSEVNGKTPLDFSRARIPWFFQLIMHLISIFLLKGKYYSLQWCDKICIEEQCLALQSDSKEENRHPNGNASLL